jgi:hypothetical protein
MKTVKEEGITYALLPVSRTLTTEEYQFLMDTLTPVELETLQVWVSAALQERDRKEKKGRKFKGS